MNLGAVGDGTTDDHAAVQAAIDKATVKQNAWVDGGFRTYAVSQPIVTRPSSRLRALTLKALPTYAPADESNAMLMTSQGYKLTFNAAGGIISTPTPHAIPSDGIAVVFKGAGLPSPLKAGRIYYALERTSMTFRVSMTKGGVPLDVADGSGVVYCEVLSLDRCHLDDVYVDGQNVSGINGIRASLQQPAEWGKVRVGNCPGTGITLDGQQWLFSNLIVVRCGVGVHVPTSSFEGYFYGSNIEQCGTGLKLVNLNDSAFWGLHMEANAVHIHFPPGATGYALAFDTPHMDVGTGIPVLCESDQTSYEIRNYRPYGGGGTNTIIEDRARGYTILKSAWGDSASWEASFAQPRGHVPPVKQVRP